MPATEASIRDVWTAYWAGKQGDVDAWDALSEVVLQAVLAELPDPQRPGIVLEAGCGTGRISAALARRGAEVVCLDIAEEALELARGAFEAEGLGGGHRFVLGSILDLPDGLQADVLWNAGVMEHFEPEDQTRAIGEFLGALRPGGRAVLLTPYSRSLPYRAAKLLLERTGRWPYGQEVPVRSLAPVLPPGARLRREYTVSFLPFLLDADKFAPALGGLGQAARRALHEPRRARRLARLDRGLSRLLGGYLLVSVIEPG